MKKPIVIITLLLLFSSALIKAQEIKKSRAQPDSVIKAIPFGYGRHSSVVYTIDGQMQTPEDVKIKLLAYAPSALEYREAKNNMTWSFVSLGGTTVFSTLALIEFDHHAKDALNNMPTGVTSVNGKPGFIYPPQQHHSLTGAFIFTGMATGLLIAAFVHFAKASRHADRMLKVYNLQYQ